MKFQDLPIKRKLVGIIFLTSFSVLILTSLALLTYEIHSFKQTTVHTLSTVADIITANSSAVLVFDDQKVAQEILSGLRAEPQITVAALFDRRGKLYAAYPTNLPSASVPSGRDPDGIRFYADYLTLYQPVLQKEARVGTLFLQADLGEMYHRLRVYGLVLLVVLAGSGVLALLLSNLLQRRISQPLLELAKAAKVVSDQKDYSVRAAKMSDDEIGYLTEAFNSMLDQIQTSHSALRASETRLSAVFNQAGAGIAQCDLSGRFLMVNDRFCEIAGHDREALLALRMHDITHEEDSRRNHLMDSKAGRDSASFVIEKRYVRSTGESVWVRENVVPLRDRDGMIESTLAVTQDIPDRKRAELELENARDAAERANRAKDEFLAALSHELRRSLSPVLFLATDSANNPDLPEDVRDTFETIAKSVSLEARLIDDLLDVTRITRGKLLLEMEPVDVHEILRDAISTIQAEIEEKGIHLQCDFKAERRVIRGDAVRVQQVFWNVLKNAVKFTPRAGTVTVQSEAKPGANEVTVTIGDTGIGMTGGELSAIFDAFKQGEHSHAESSQRFGGLGLGLAITRMLVEMHAGAIHASSPGRNLGSTFTIVFPLAPSESGSTDPQAVNGPHASAPAETPVGEMRILVVEDHEPTRVTLMHLLNRRGHTVHAAGSLAEARKIAGAESIDVIISDAGLPDGNGFTLMKELRVRHPKLRGIALSGYGAEEDIARSQQAGFGVHLTKPVRVQALDGALAEVTAPSTR